MKLIDANKVIEQIERREKICVKDKDGYINLSTDAFKEFINNRPTVDAEPVVHAKWELQHCESRGIFYICSNCEHGFKSITECCPHCGAKMDEGDKEEK